MPKRNDLKKVLVIGSGPIVIGQAAEFDYAGTQACLSLKEEGIEVVLVNSNPATIMTDETVADHIYIEPLTTETVTAIIAKEKPDGMIGTLGGQTGLNLTIALYEKGILDQFGVELLGTSAASIQKGEDRNLFRSLMFDIGEPVPESRTVESLEEGVIFAEESGFPVIIRPAYTLGGAGGGFAYDMAEFETVLQRGLSMSPIHQVLAERSIKGWKEIEYEVMRDENDTCTIVCNMENMDPVGVHTGDSIVTAPSQTLSDVQYQKLRDASLKIIRALNVIGGCNVQFALHPQTGEYCVIEVNPRVSRSSALASKATGYPIARIAAKCAVGYRLDEIINPITGTTFASFEPALDYTVVKLPRFPSDKFPEADRTLGTQMKATGEVMAIDRSFEGALNKALRSMENSVYSLQHPACLGMADEDLTEAVQNPSDLRLYAIAEAFRRGWTVQKAADTTDISSWFLRKVKNIVDCENEVAAYSWERLPYNVLRKAKRMNISDRRLAALAGTDEKSVRRKLETADLAPGFKLVDTCAAEFDAVTPYYYSTWQGEDEVMESKSEKILVVGSGPIRIGQGIEFDYCSVQAAEAVKQKGFEAVVMNNNPETVSTDFSAADRLYFEPLAVEDILAVAKKEKVTGVLVQFGGQTAVNTAQDLADEGIPILGTSLEAIDTLEDREGFYALLNDLHIPHIPGETVHNREELYEKAEKTGYPVVVRPSYVIGGSRMEVCYTPADLHRYVDRFMETEDKRTWPLLLDSFIPGRECEMDVISDGSSIAVPGIFEHVERAGVHSGDSTALFPPFSLTDEEKQTMTEYAGKIATTAPVKGIMNIQFVIHGGTVYVLEVNPRASRTVPIMSKVTGVPMIEWAVRIQLGEKLKDVSDIEGLMDEPGFYTVKSPVFSASSLPGADTVLGPEMKSTGEILGCGRSLEEAVQKVIAVKEDPADESVLLCSIADHEKEESIPLIKELSNLGWTVKATVGTARMLWGAGIDTGVIPDNEELLEHLFRKEQPHAVICTAGKGQSRETFGFALRSCAVKYNVPYFTNLDTARFWQRFGAQKPKTPLTPRRMSEYRNSAEMKNGVMAW
ncbi:carbamoyl-phosphate synthase (glutamine-hydrolyzing) large subunit [Alteribacter natronophilus]|uniref:carbamoyl-phosphate synthase (glutamine-hydrolyzing) large subunit n=1 Tax=Alteribacter natronophilus TaxID=2583810 RepID=UPI00110D5A2A|nr:carbamoyl-phosphate synthase (glutamine-hydrolyzing) large subunit [Alteribacter natronophilus]TMW72499.1 carbamoyl-phosphate synthase (glutamine-hydrolyzing) large subunit [Alteribacter natronophilus]